MVKRPTARHMLFTYETLRQKMTQRKALGHTEAERRAILPGWTEIFVGEGKTPAAKWPTIIPATHSIGGAGAVKGDILLVTVDDLKKLDKWEDHYKRIKVTTSAGEAWTYVYNRGRDAL